MDKLTVVRSDADERATNGVAQASGLSEGADVEVVARSLSVDQLLVVESVGLVEQQEYKAMNEGIICILSCVLVK